MKIQTDDADGYLDIELAGKDPVRLDLFIAHDTFTATISELPENSTGADYLRSYVKAAAELGFGEVSSRTAKLIADAVFDRMDALRKKEPSPAPTL
jgi:hypothetical protein